ncbi:MAG: hypothetical protein ACRC9Y_02005 [Aeromonas veronii]
MGIRLSDEEKRHMKAVMDFADVVTAPGIKARELEEAQAKLSQCRAAVAACRTTHSIEHREAVAVEAAEAERRVTVLQGELAAAHSALKAHPKYIAATKTAGQDFYASESKADTNQPKPAAKRGIW